MLFTDVNSEAGAPHDADLYLSLLIDHLDGRLGDDELLCRMQRRSYAIPHRRLRFKVPAARKVLGDCLPGLLRRLPEMDNTDEVPTLYTRLASLVARAAAEPQTLATMAAWLVAHGVGGLMTAFEFQDKANKLLALIDRVSDGGDFVDAFVESELLKDLLFTPT